MCISGLICSPSVQTVILKSDVALPIFLSVPGSKLSIIAKAELAVMQFHTDPACKLSANLYDICHCCVYSEKLLMMDRGNCLKHVQFHSKNIFEKLVHLVGFIVRNLT